MDRVKNHAFFDILGFVSCTQFSHQFATVSCAGVGILVLANGAYMQCCRLLVFDDQHHGDPRTTESGVSQGVVSFLFKRKDRQTFVVAGAKTMEVKINDRRHSLHDARQRYHGGDRVKPTVVDSGEVQMVQGSEQRARTCMARSTFVAKKKKKIGGARA